MSYPAIPYLIGLLFLIAGLIKATHPDKFIRYINKLEIFSLSFGPLIALVLTELECAIGFALIFNFLLIDLIPPLLVFLLLATSVSWWAIYKGKTSDCGCYGSIIWISPKVSWVINLICCIFLYLYWIELNGPQRVAEWKIWSVAGVLVVVNILFKTSLKKPLINLSPIKPGNRWKSKWLETDQKIEELEKILIVFLNQRCSKCQIWISQLNKIEDLKIVAISAQSESLPPPQTAPSESPQFPIKIIKDWKFNYLVDFQPQGILLERGKITKIWNGDFPDQLAELTVSAKN